MNKFYMYTHERCWRARDGPYESNWKTVLEPGQILHVYPTRMKGVGEELEREMARADESNWKMVLEPGRLLIERKLSSSARRLGFSSIMFALPLQ